MRKIKMKKARPCELIGITIINIWFTIKNSNNQYNNGYSAENTRYERYLGIDAENFLIR